MERYLKLQLTDPETGAVIDEWKVGYEYPFDHETGEETPPECRFYVHQGYLDSYEIGSAVAREAQDFFREDLKKGQTTDA